MVIPLRVVNVREYNRNCLFLSCLPADKRENSIEVSIYWKYSKVS